MSFTKLYSLVLVTIMSSLAWSQDVHFSQFGQTPQLINPGATGVVNGAVRAHLNYRSQWGGIGAFKTDAASIDMPIAKGNGQKGYFGVGANFYKDVAGDSDFGNFLGSLSIVFRFLSIPRYRNFSPSSYFLCRSLRYFAFAICWVLRSQNFLDSIISSILSIGSLSGARTIICPSTET